MLGMLRGGTFLTHHLLCDARLPVLPSAAHLLKKQLSYSSVWWLCLQALKEGFLKERMAQLEAELAAAQRREGVLEEDAQKVKGGAFGLLPG
jgi:hypothetical protein